MRITISHKKNKQEVMRLVDDSVEELLKGSAIAPLEIVDASKSWEGSTMDFRFTGKAGFVKAPVTGKVIVTDTDVTVHFELPSFLQKLLPEEKVRTGIQNKVRGLLKGRTG